MRALRSGEATRFDWRFGEGCDEQSRAAPMPRWRCPSVRRGMRLRASRSKRRWRRRMVGAWGGLSSGSTPCDARLAGGEYSHSTVAASPRVLLGLYAGLTLLP
jgi:hypothetical protein